MNRRPATRRVTPDELEQLAFESGEPIVFGVDLATLRTNEGIWFAKVQPTTSTTTVSQ